MLYSLRAVRSDWDRCENRRPESGSFWKRYSMILRTISEQPRVFGIHQIDEGGR
jgi:hypothetical protein